MSICEPGNHQAVYLHLYICLDLGCEGEESGYLSAKVRAQEALEEGGNIFCIFVWPVEWTSHAKQALQPLQGGVAWLG